MFGPLVDPSQVKQELKENPDEMEVQDGDEDDGLLDSDDDENKPFDPSDSEAEEGLLSGD